MYVGIRVYKTFCIIYEAKRVDRWDKVYEVDAYSYNQALIRFATGLAYHVTLDAIEYLEAHGTVVTSVKSQRKGDLRSKLTKSDFIRQYLAEGLTTSEICAILDVSRQLVYSVKRRMK